MSGHRPNVRRRADCRLCADTRLEPVLRLAPTPIADDYRRPEDADKPQELYPLEWALCLGCGHIQLRDTVNPELLFHHYTFATASSLGLVEHFARLADALTTRFAFPTGSLALDIGSNDGSLLKLLQARGLRGLGVDPAREIADKATRAGTETIADFFTSSLARRLRAERGPAHLVTAMNVFAHSDALGDMAEGIHELLADDGIFVFEVSYLPDILDEMLFDTIYHEHVSYHSVGPLTDFFARRGLELFDVERITTKGGSLRVFVQKKGGPRHLAPAVNKLVAEEKRRGLDRPEPYREFSRRIEAAKSETLAIIDGLRRNGLMIAGYGASVTVTTLLHHFELGSRLEFLVDDNPLKQGTISPGARLPVLAPSALYERRPGAIVILAWKYADPILRKHEKFLAQGGRFLIPLPQPRLIP